MAEGSDRIDGWWNDKAITNCGPPMGDSNRDAFYQTGSPDCAGVFCASRGGSVFVFKLFSGDSNDAPGIERDSLFLTRPSLLSRGTLSVCRNRKISAKGGPPATLGFVRDRKIRIKGGPPARGRHELITDPAGSL